MHPEKAGDNDFTLGRRPEYPVVNARGFNKNGAFWSNKHYTCRGDWAGNRNTFYSNPG